MVFYTAINPIVLIEFIDIREISNLDARLSLGNPQKCIVVSMTCEEINRDGKPECAAIFHSAEMFGVVLMSSDLQQQGGFGMSAHSLSVIN
jgi:hypothetical protein